MLVIKGTLPIDPGEREEALSLVENLAESSRADEGVIDYRVATDVNDQNAFNIFEQYEDETAFESHMETDHVQNFMAKLPDLLAGEVDATRFEIASSSDLEI